MRNAFCGLIILSAQLDAFKQFRRYRCIRLIGLTKNCHLFQRNGTVAERLVIQYLGTAEFSDVIILFAVACRQLIDSDDLVCLAKWIGNCGSACNRWLIARFALRTNDERLSAIKRFAIRSDDGVDDVRLDGVSTVGKRGIRLSHVEW